VAGDALSFVPVAVQITAAANVQNAVTTLGTTDTFLPPVKYRLDTKTILARLLAAEWQAGRLATPSNFIGATLCLNVCVEDVSQSYFCAMFAGAMYADFTEEMKFTSTGGIYASGKHENTRDLMAGVKFIVAGKINFDDTANGGGLKFETAGNFILTGTDTAAAGALNYTEQVGIAAQRWPGYGQFTGKEMWLDFSMTGTGKKLFWF
jgi:hypothetical protein